MEPAPSSPPTPELGGAGRGGGVAAGCREVFVAVCFRGLVNDAMLLPLLFWLYLLLFSFLFIQNVIPVSNSRPKMIPGSPQSRNTPSGFLRLRTATGMLLVGRVCTSEETEKSSGRLMGAVRGLDCKVGRGNCAAPFVAGESAHADHGTSGWLTGASGFGPIIHAREHKMWYKFQQEIRYGFPVQGERVSPVCL